MNIIRYTVPKSRAAVDQFSGAISAHPTKVMPMMYLKALGLAPSSVCFLLRMKAVTMMMAILANSEGWKSMPKRLSQREAPFTAVPMIITSIRRA